MKTQDDSNREFFLSKGFDVTTAAGLQSAKAWLRTADPNDMFFTDAPDGEPDPFDFMMGQIRKKMLGDWLESL